MPAEEKNPALVLPLRGFCRRPPIFAAPGATVGEAARLMRERRIGSLLVAGPPLGILTDRDLRSRVLAEGKGPETPVAEVLSRPVWTLGADASSVDALLLMAERGIRHLPLVEGGRVVGLVSASDLVQAQADDPLAVLRRLERAPAQDARPHAQEIGEAVARLAEAGVAAPRIGGLVAAFNDALARRILARVERELGPAPVACALLVYGSDGRREQLLPTDQDNALVWADPEPGAEEVARGYFEGFAARVVAELVAAGFPPCPGGYMATRWRFPLVEAARLFEGFLDRPRPEQVVDICSFFDFRVAAGGLGLEPLEEIRRRAAGAKRLLRLLAADAEQMRLPLGWLGGLREGKQGFDLKRGILLIVSLARLFALEAGSSEVGTLGRLRDAEATIGKGDAETLAEAFRFLVGLRLDEQLAGHAHGSRVELKELNAMEISFLEDVFHFLRRLQAALPQRFAL